MSAVFLSSIWTGQRWCVTGQEDTNALLCWSLSLTPSTEYALPAWDFLQPFFALGIRQRLVQLEPILLGFFMGPGHPPPTLCSWYPYH